MQRTCAAIFGADAGRNIEDLVERSTGHPCPCKQGQRCPLVDEDGFNPLALVLRPPAA